MVTSRSHGNWRLKGSSMNRKNWAVTMQLRMSPIREPMIRAVRMTEYCSYMKHLIPWFLVRPMARRQPYSQTFSRMLLVVEIRSRKKERVMLMTPTTRVNTLKTAMAACRESSSSFLSSRMVV